MQNFILAKIRPAIANKITAHYSLFFVYLTCILQFSCTQGTPLSENASIAKQEVKQDRHRPNIIVIYTDDMNFNDAGVFGGKVLTPTIDKLASEGARLDRYYAASPVCTPSRYTILTGLYASRSSALLDQYPISEPAFLRWNTHIGESDTTVAELLKGSGYTTGMVGKYHNIDNEDIQLKNPKDADPRDPAIKQRIAANYKNLRSKIQALSGFDYVESIYPNNLHALELPQALQEHNQEWITEAALNFIDRHANKPFYLYFATTTPHVPAPVVSMKADPRITPAGYLSHIPRVQASRESVFKRVKDAGLKEETAVMLWIDDAITALVDKLKSHDILDDTLIIFASDHSGAHGGRGKMTNYEGGVSTPAFVWWKDNIISGNTIDALTTSVDIVPTILDAAGVSHEAMQLDGVSWLPLLTGKTDTLREDAYLEITYTRGVVTDEWKYIAIRFPSHIQAQAKKRPDSVNQEGLGVTHDVLAGTLRSRYNAHELYPGYFDADQLYHLKSDPKEQVNLANVPEHQERLNIMKKKLRKYTQDLPHAFGEFK